MMEYFYKDNDCKAANAEAPDCICWHAQGTGPYPNAAPNQPPEILLRWRAAPLRWQPIGTAPFDKLVLLTVEAENGDRKVFVAQADNNGWQITTSWVGWSKLHFGWKPTHWTWLPAPAAPAPVACNWCCGTGRWSDHVCRFCNGAAAPAQPAAPTRKKVRLTGFIPRSLNGEYELTIGDEVVSAEPATPTAPYDMPSEREVLAAAHAALKWHYENPHPADMTGIRQKLDSAIALKLSAALAAAPAAPAQPQSLLRKPVSSIAEISAAIPGGCYCPPDKCGAPVIMGRQTPCLRRKDEAAPAAQASPQQEQKP